MLNKTIKTVWYTFSVGGTFLLNYLISSPYIFLVTGGAIILTYLLVYIIETAQKQPISTNIEGKIF